MPWCNARSTHSKHNDMKEKNKFCSVQYSDSASDYATSVAPDSINDIGTGDSDVSLLIHTSFPLIDIYNRILQILGQKVHDHTKTCAAVPWHVPWPYGIFSVNPGNIWTLTGKLYFSSMISCIHWHLSDTGKGSTLQKLLSPCGFTNLTVKLAPQLKSRDSLLRRKILPEKHTLPLP